MCLRFAGLCVVLIYISYFVIIYLTHWGRGKHTCVDKLIIIGSDNGLSPWRRQAIIWTNAGILLIEPLGTNFGDILIEIYTLSFEKIHLKMSTGKWQPSYLAPNVFRCSSGLFHGQRALVQLRGAIGVICDDIWGHVFFALTHRYIGQSKTISAQ